METTGEDPPARCGSSRRSGLVRKWPVAEVVRWMGRATANVSCWCLCLCQCQCQCQCLCLCLCLCLGGTLTPLPTAQPCINQAVSAAVRQQHTQTRLAGEKRGTPRHGQLVGKEREMANDGDTVGRSVGSGDSSTSRYPARLSGTAATRLPGERCEEKFPPMMVRKLGQKPPYSIHYHQLS